MTAHASECPYGAGKCPRVSDVRDDLKTLDGKVDDLTTNVATLTTQIKYMTACISALLLAVFGVSLI